MRSQILIILSFVLLMVVTLGACATLEGPPPSDGIPICLNEPQRCPDLVPAIVTNKEDLDEGKACDFCRQTERDGNRAMEVSVRNQGGIGYHKEPLPGLPTLGNPNAPASVTRVIFTGEGGNTTTVDIPTPALAVGFTVDLEPVIYPPECINHDCHVTITADVNGDVVESVEGNNTVSCFLPFIP